MSHDDERSELSAEERDFVARLREGYKPEPLAGARATAFHARLEERFETSRSSRGWFPLGVLAAGAAALALALLTSSGNDAVTTLPGVTPPSQSIEGQTVAQADAPAAPAAPTAAARATADEDLLEYAMLDDDTDEEESGYLPDDYEALAGILDDATEDADAES